MSIRFQGSVVAANNSSILLAAPQVDYNNRAELDSKTAVLSGYGIRSFAPLSYPYRTCPNNDE
jgi:hypothetical protein